MASNLALSLVDMTDLKIKSRLPRKKKKRLPLGQLGKAIYYISLIFFFFLFSIAFDRLMVIEIRPTICPGFAGTVLV